DLRDELQALHTTQLFLQMVQILGNGFLGLVKVFRILKVKVLHLVQSRHHFADNVMGKVLDIDLARIGLRQTDDHKGDREKENGDCGKGKGTSVRGEVEG